ncbi:hypothetical protein TNCV_3945381 [Trichonephila clavipes]|nr:hypothetical protein TNCV_3945381 [Trichonephila clavipes]
MYAAQQKKKVEYPWPSPSKASFLRGLLRMFSPKFLPRAAVAQCQGIGSLQTRHEFKPNTTKDPPCRATMHFKSVVS